MKARTEGGTLRAVLDTSDMIKEAEPVQTDVAYKPNLFFQHHNFNFRLFPELSDVNLLLILSTYPYILI